MRIGAATASWSNLSRECQKEAALVAGWCSVPGRGGGKHRRSRPLRRSGHLPVPWSSNQSRRRHASFVRVLDTVAAPSNRDGGGAVSQSTNRGGGGRAKPGLRRGHRDIQLTEPSLGVLSGEEGNVVMLGRCDDVVRRGRKRGGTNEGLQLRPGFCCPTGISSGNNLQPSVS